MSRREQLLFSIRNSKSHIPTNEKEYKCSHENNMYSQITANIHCYHGTTKDGERNTKLLRTLSNESSQGQVKKMGREDDNLLHLPTKQ